MTRAARLSKRGDLPDVFDLIEVRWTEGRSPIEEPIQKGNANAGTDQVVH